MLALGHVLPGELPLARPGLISIGIFNFPGMWNQYLLPLCAYH